MSTLSDFRVAESGNRKNAAGSNAQSLSGTRGASSANAGRGQGACALSSPGNSLTSHRFAHCKQLEYTYLTMNMYGVGCERARSPLRTCSASTPFTPDVLGEQKRQMPGGICLLLGKMNAPPVAARKETCCRRNRPRRMARNALLGSGPQLFRVCLPQTVLQPLPVACPPCERCAVLRQAR